MTQDIVSILKNQCINYKIIYYYIPLYVFSFLTYYSQSFKTELSRAYLFEESALPKILYSIHKSWKVGYSYLKSLVVVNATVENSGISL